MTLAAVRPSQVHVTVSSLFLYSTTTGWTGRPGIKAPGLNVIKHERFVVVPSGNIKTWDQSLSGFVRFLISSIVFNLFLESSRETNIGCAYFKQNMMLVYFEN